MQEKDNLNLSDNQTGDSSEVKNAPNNKKKPGILGFIRNHTYLTTMLAGLLLIVIVYFWKDIQGRNERKAILEKANIELKNKNHEMMALLCKPLVWAIRAELLRNNLEQVDIFTSDLVKEKNFKSITLVEPSGNIIISTNKKLEGQPASALFDTAILSTDSTVVISMENGELLVASPVMGYDKRLGTLVINYNPENFNIGDSKLNEGDENNVK